MPFAIGWHPAFLTSTNKQRKQFVRLASSITGTPKDYDIDIIKERSKAGYIVESAMGAEYACESGTISVASELGYVQLWSPPDQNQICLEPISAPPDRDYEGELAEKKGYRTLSPQALEEFKFRVGILSKALMENR
jgi:galactose mutarotase-like enzyme